MTTEWPFYPLANVCEFLDRRGVTPEKLGSRFTDSGFRVISAKNIKARRIDTDVGEQRFVNEPTYRKWMKSPLLADDVLLTSEAPLGEPAYVSSDLSWCLGQRLFGIRTNKSKVFGRFLFYAFQSPVVRSDLLARATGATAQGIRQAELKNVAIPVPPLPEQRRIVGILDAAFEGIATAKANAEKNLQNARALFESVLNAAIQGELVGGQSGDKSVEDLIDEIRNSRNAAIARGKAKTEKSNSVEWNSEGDVVLPKSWRWVKLESLTVGISDGVHKKPHYVSSGVPFITVKNLTAGRGISFDELNYITPKDHKEFIKRTHPEKGDILITKDGTIGVVRLIDTDTEFSIFVSVALIKPVMKELSPYLTYALRASCVQGQIVPQGAALKHLYLVDLRRLAIPLPPLKEQKRIVTALGRLELEAERLVEIYERKIAALDALRKSLLHQAFTGQL